MEITRRGLLKTAAGAVASGMGGTLSLRDLAAYAAEPPPATLQFDSEIEAIVRLIEETPRERCVPVFIDQVRRGLPYRRFLAAAFFACVRKQHSHHDVYKIHSVHQVSMDVRPEERLLPLFWALNAFKQRQEDFPARSLTKLNGPFPSPEIAASEFRDAMQSTDMERAESALITLARNQGARPTMELLWSIGCRNGHAGGHGAISVANCFRALETIGWQQAESVLRFVVQDLFFLQYVKPDAYFETNSARVDQHLNSLPQDWAGDKADPEATHELFQLLRQGQANAACELATEQLLRKVGAQAIWDAVHLATAELMVRHNSGWGLASRPLHSNTSINAMHYTFRTATSARTRLLVLLQAVAWAADKTRSELTAQALREISIVELPQESIAASNEDAVAEIFALLPARSYKWDTQSKQAELFYGERGDADRACRKTFALANQRPDAVPLFVQTANSSLCRKASNDHHEYKFLAAILEDATWVSPRYKPHLLAASVHYFHGVQSPDHPVVQQVRDTL